MVSLVLDALEGLIVTEELPPQSEVIVEELPLKSEVIVEELPLKSEVIDIRRVVSRDAYASKKSQDCDKLR